VPAATANLIYTTQPLYTALFAWVLLGESLGPQGYGGGLLILLSVLLVTLEGNDK
jgi:drug/metabolite transporter (DMT)-like permease